MANSVLFAKEDKSLSKCSQGQETPAGQQTLDPGSVLIKKKKKDPDPT
jgi:hypothetical protein